MENSAPNPDQIMQIGMGFWASKTLLTAVELEIFTILAEGPLDFERLKVRAELHPRSAQDFLDTLVALGMLQREQSTYRNTPETDLFLDKNKPSYIGGILEMANNRLYPFWGHLTEALRTGLPQNEAKHNIDFFGKLYSEPVLLKEFLKAMSGVSHGANMAIAAKFPWANYKTFIDLGSAQGDLPAQIALQHSHMSGTGFDLPAVEPIFTEHMQALGITDRIKFAAGDFFSTPIPKADVLLMGHILHDWDLEQKKQLLAIAYQALPKGGALIVYDSLIDDDRKTNVFGLLMSLNMLIETPGGFDYTGADCCTWMKEAGFSETKVEHLVGPDSMIIGIK